MPTGRIKYYNSQKGFGFIAQDSGEQDLFMHISSVKKHEGEIQPGHFVYYEIGQGRKGLEAKNIIVSSRRIDESKLQEILKPKRRAPRPKGKGGPKQPQRQAQPTQPQVKKKKKLIPDDAYMIKQAKNQTPMVFEIYDHPHLKCLVKKKYKYDIDLLIDGEVKRFFMHDIKFCYKVRDEEKVKRAISYDEEVRSQNLKAIIPRKERYKIPDEELKKAYKEEKPIMLVMRGGEVIIGTIEWYSKYAIKVNLPIGGSVLAFRHAVYKFQSL